MRRLLVAVLALILAVQIGRLAAVRALAETDAVAAGRVWSTHPDVLLPQAMTAIAQAARNGTPVTPATFDQIFAAAGKSPLSPEPFLVRGVQAQIAGDRALAEQAFVAAKWRDGRSLPARYFLADQYFHEGDARRGLGEISALARLAPNGVSSLAPFVASYARDRSTWPQLRSLFRSEPALEDATLVALAQAPANADLVMALADPSRRESDSRWLAPLLSSLIEAREYDKARRVWATATNAQLHPRAPIHDPEFKRGDAPPPFNWLLTSSAVGLAERQQGGGLHVLFHGRDDGPLARQLLVLPPGRYRLSAAAAGSLERAGALQWRLVCAPTNAVIAFTPLSAAIGRGWPFEVPAACAGQWLELFGSSPDLPQQADVIVRRVSITPERPNA